MHQSRGPTTGATMSTGSVVALFLLGIGALLVGSAAVSEAGGRRGGAEDVIRAYFFGLENLDADLSVAQIVPEARERLRSFVENGAGNHYEIVGIAVQQRSLLDRWRGAQADVMTATIFLDITQADGNRWQAGPRVSLVQREGRWFLGDAPLRPPES